MAKKSGFRGGQKTHTVHTYKNDAGAGGGGLLARGHKGLLSANVFISPRPSLPLTPPQRGKNSPGFVMYSTNKGLLHPFCGL